MEKLLSSWYKIKALGPIKRYLGIEVKYYPEGKMTLDQTPYLLTKLNLFKQYWEMYPKAKKTPLPYNAAVLLVERSTPDREGMSEWVKTYPYREIVGALLYLAVNTRPDIAQAVGMLATYCTAPTYNSCLCLSYVLSYLSGTPELGVVYSRTEHGLDLHAYSDADWAGELENRRSTAGYIVFGALGPLSWGSKLIKTVYVHHLWSQSIVQSIMHYKKYYGYEHF